MHSSSEAEVCLCHHQVARNTATAAGCKPTHLVTLIRGYHLPLLMELSMKLVYYIILVTKYFDIKLI